MLQGQIVSVIYSIGAIIDPLTQVQIAAARGYGHIERQVAVAKNIVVVMKALLYLTAVNQ
jgi:hypothetical protein